MRRNNKTGEWREIFILTRHDIEPAVKPGGPAVRLTYSRFGNEVRFSHTAGIVGDDGFRSIQHIHHRNVNDFCLLLSYSHAMAEALRGLDPNLTDAQRGEIKGILQRVRAMDLLSQQMKRDLQDPANRKVHHPEPNPPREKPAFGASIGDMLKAKSSGD